MLFSQNIAISLLLVPDNLKPTNFPKKLENLSSGHSTQRSNKDRKEGKCRWAKGKTWSQVVEVYSRFPFGKLSQKMFTAWTWFLVGNLHDFLKISLMYIMLHQYTERMLSISNNFCSVSFTMKNFSSLSRKVLFLA